MLSDLGYHVLKAKDAYTIETLAKALEALADS
jgi:hypothetical protein